MIRTVTTLTMTERSRVRFWSSCNFQRWSRPPLSPLTCALRSFDACRSAWTSSVRSWLPCQRSPLWPMCWHSSSLRFYPKAIVLSSHPGMCGKQPLVSCDAKAERAGWGQDQCYQPFGGQDPNRLHRWVGEWFFSRVGIPKASLQVITAAKNSKNACCGNSCHHRIYVTVPKGAKDHQGRVPSCKAFAGAWFSIMWKAEPLIFLWFFFSLRAIEALALEERCKPNTKLLWDIHGCEIYPGYHSNACLLHDHPKWGI